MRVLLRDNAGLEDWLICDDAKWFDRVGLFYANVEGLVSEVIYVAGSRRTFVLETCTVECSADLQFGWRWWEMSLFYGRLVGVWGWIFGWLYCVAMVINW